MKRINYDILTSNPEEGRLIPEDFFPKGSTETVLFHSGNILYQLVFFNISPVFDEEFLYICNLEVTTPIRVAVGERLFNFKSLKKANINPSLAKALTDLIEEYAKRGCSEPFSI
ncbi:MAG: hypothetical protein K6A80_06170 [Saccharofermentans sp.]|nr:hypothetical protein [Saccharofermentans sp.]